MRLLRKRANVCPLVTRSAHQTQRTINPALSGRGKRFPSESLGYRATTGLRAPLRDTLHTPIGHTRDLMISPLEPFNYCTRNILTHKWDFSPVMCGTYGRRGWQRFQHRVPVGH